MSQGNVKIVRRVLDAWERRDFDAALSLAFFSHYSGGVINGGLRRDGLGTPL
jgi:hypothetical protein